MRIWMKESAKSSDTITRGIIFVLYVTLFLISITYVSMIQINMNTTESYALNILYEQHTATGNGYSIDHDYHTITVNIPIKVDNFESILSSYRIGSFPLWIDTSDWTSGETVSISGNHYTVTSGSISWRAYRDFNGGNDDEELYYHRILGILMESHTNQLTFSSSGFTGSDVDIEIQRSNIDGFVARVTGNNVVGYILLISAIFTEIIVIQGLWERRKGSSSPKQESN